MDSLIAAIDPGTVKVGYCILDGRGRAVDLGVIKPVSKLLHERLRDIQDALDKLFARHRPVEVAVETPYVGKNPGAALTLAGGRAMAMVSAARVGAKVFEYTAPEAKRAVAAKSKSGVQRMIQLLLGLQDPPPEDAADAAALAILHQGRTGRV